MEFAQLSARLRCAVRGPWHRLEVGIIGREGMTGLPVILGNDRSPNETFIRVEGVNQLDRKGVIRLSRGRIEVIDRDGLINSANGTYSIPEAMARKNGIAIWSKEAPRREVRLRQSSASIPRS
jgi:hypothetical protein